MRKTLLLFLFVMAAGVSAFAQMTDSQVINYVQDGLKAGKSQQQIGVELMSRGVTQAQVERLRNQHEHSDAASGAAGVDKAVAIRDDMVPDPSDDRKPDLEPSSRIYGHSIFRHSSLTFEPNTNAATPENYVLGPGDEVIIEIWGINEANMSQTITPEGRISISQIGPVQLSGLTIAQAEAKIARLLRSKYESLGDNQSSVSVTLGKIRTIQVNVLGEVTTPGTYRVSSFSTVLNVLYRAGGVNARGSIRNVNVVRGGKVIAEIDIYSYLLDGRTDEDIRLNEGDVVMVPTFGRIVSIEGKVKRPMAYELREGETLADLISYAGDFASDACRSDARVMRQTGPEKEVFTVKAENFASFRMDDGDAVEIGAAIDRYANMVEIRGFVFRPGTYQVGGDIATVRQLVERAGGLTEDAFADRVILMREKEDLSHENISINLGELLSGRADDVLLKKNDVLVISGIREVETNGKLYINGRVKNPGDFEFVDNITVEDLILMAGGLMENASTARVDVFRRRLDRAAMEYTSELGESFSFPLKDGLVMDGGDAFILEPYDIVSVRSSPGYRRGRIVEIHGEVLFPGTYILQSDSETLSELIKRAGGLNPTAYARGASITRNNEMKASASTAGAILAKMQDRNDDDENSNADRSQELIAQLAASTYNVALDLEKAIAEEHGDADIILREGDQIFIPALLNEVRVVGEVMLPSSLQYSSGTKLLQYVEMAGGFSRSASRRYTYVVYPNGSSSKKKSAEVEPGSTVIVPAKSERKLFNLGEATSMASAATSIVSALAIIASLFL